MFDSQWCPWGANKHLNMRKTIFYLKSMIFIKALHIMVQYHPTKLFFYTPFCDSGYNFWLRGGMTPIFSPTCSSTNLQQFEYPYHGMMTSRKFCRGIWNSKTPLKTHMRPHFRYSKLCSEKARNSKKQWVACLGL